MRRLPPRIALGQALVLLLAADDGFVGFNGPAGAAKRSRVGLGHGLADAMAHEPRRLVGHSKRATDLVGADALLAGGHEVGGPQPLIQRHLGAFEHDQILVNFVEVLGEPSVLVLSSVCE